MAAYRSKGAWSGNAATYSMGWKKVHRVAPTLADALAQLLGVGCTVVLYGPRDDGNIDVTSVDGMVPESASKAECANDFDPKRMAEVKTFFRDYATDMFTEATCQSRVYDEEAGDEEAGDEEAGNNELENEEGLSTATNPSPVSPDLASPTLASPIPTATTTPIDDTDAPAMSPAATAAASSSNGSEEEENNRESPNPPATPSLPLNNTPVSSAVANG
ncbi:hypothetical protein MPER_06966 [Moniliophthora perniciosa FA553]|nr:hypothetical protein MPER_06966 [Moniliophthora perniciosa FA553]